MRILLTNDDGIDAIGINVLAEELKKRGHHVIMVAPESERSASSHSITIRKPLYVQNRGTDRHAVTGTPVDCVFMAQQMILKQDPDIVISGINSGQNMGEDILYSGTVAAALEAMFLGWKSIAVSIQDYKDQHFETAAWYIAEMLERGIADLVGEENIININVPNLPRDQVRGIQLTRPGHRHYRNFVRECIDEEGNMSYIVGGDIQYWSKDDGTDFACVHAGSISISPLYPDFMCDNTVKPISRWIDNVDLFEQPEDPDEV